MDYNCPRAIVASARNYDAALETPPHTHPRGQLIYAERGNSHDHCRNRHLGGSAKPGGLDFGWRELNVTRLTVNTEIRSIYIRKDAISGLPIHCAVIQVNPLLRELILVVVRLPALYDEDGADGRLVDVLLDRVAALPQEPLHLPTPTSAKLRAVAADLAERPDLPLAKAARYAAMQLMLLCSAFLG